MNYAIFFETGILECQDLHDRGKNPFKQRRLDYFLISDSLQDSVSSISISPSVQSDHSTIVLIISPLKNILKELLTGNLVTLC